MKAAFYEKCGAAHDVLLISELPDPIPGPGEVRVRIAFSGLNPTDIKSRTGFAGSKQKFPRIIPHQDGSGVIDMVGSGVTAERIGQKVWVYEAQSGRASGTAAQYVVIPSQNAVVLPDNVSFETGACLGIPAMTAHRCLFADGDLRGKWVLIQGGAGAVGTAAILLSKWAGARVITTVSRPEQENVVRKLGADIIVNRHTEDVAERVKQATGGFGVDRIVDVDLVSNLNTDVTCLKKSGVISAYATEEPSAQLHIPFLKTMFEGFVFRFVFVYTMPEEARNEAIRDITACLRMEAYTPEIALTLPLADIAVGHEAMEQSKAIGKILISLE
ncbi:NADPH:quinone reductase [Yersinia enterocolitica]|uniref:NADPH:quinone reductase n=1 Tax=Yersinia enterocolitica TaxID=630 RepID=UPI0030D443A3